MDLATVKSFVPAPARRFLAHVVRRDRGLRPRHYIPHGTSVEDFFTGIKSSSAKCVVLRWFETLPEIEPGEDIDMLVADEDLPAVLARLDRTSGSVPCDVYTVGGIAGTQYQGLPYFPAALATKIVERREVRDGLYQVPSPTDYFHGLAYHAVYQKGPASGLPSRLSEVVSTHRPEHDYASVLSRLRDDLNLSVSINLESLDDLLAKEGYRPPHYVLRRLAKNNEWIARRFFSRP